MIRRPSTLLALDCLLAVLAAALRPRFEPALLTFAVPPLPRPPRRVPAPRSVDPPRCKVA